MALRRTAYANGGMINSKENSILGILPPFLSLALRKINQFQVMPVRILKIKSLNTCRRWDRGRQCLRISRYLRDTKTAKKFIGTIHITHNNGYMLESQIVALKIFRNGSAATG